MSIVPETLESDEVASDETFHFDYPGSDIVLRSCETHDFRVPKLYIVNSSPVLRELIRSVSNSCDVPNEEPFPEVKLPESGATLYSLLTFILPVTPILPSTAENIMELLAVAQKYQMVSVLGHIRGTIARQDPPFIRPETAFHQYFLAQRHELLQEAVQAARVTLRLSMTIEDLGDKLDFPGMSGAYLYELWNYHKRVRTNLKSGVFKFRNSGLPDKVKALLCVTCPRRPEPSFPHWLDDYIESIAEAPHLFDLIEFENVRVDHIKREAQAKEAYRPGICSCADISNQVIRAFWEALTAVIRRSIAKADSTLALVKPPKKDSTSDPLIVPLFLDIPDAQIILRSSDQVDFRVHKSLLAMSSSLFKTMFSLPQPPVSDGDVVDGLSVISLSEDAGLLNSLVSLLYPISPVIPSSYEKALALLAACQKYDMVSVQSNIRAAIKLGIFPAPPVGTEAFSAYAVASSMGLVPEMENAADLTLKHTLTFESLGEGLRSFKGGALCDLVSYRKRMVAPPVRRRLMLNMFNILKD